MSFKIKYGNAKVKDSDGNFKSVGFAESCHAYMHCLQVSIVSPSWKLQVINLFNSSPNPITTKSEITSYLYNNGFTTYDKLYTNIAAVREDMEYYGIYSPDGIKLNLYGCNISSGQGIMNVDLNIYNDLVIEL